MLDVLLKDAIKKVWCSPYMDSHAILQLTRISPISKFRDYFSYQWRRVILPTPNQSYHVYGIGHNTSARLNLIETRNTWVPLSQLGKDLRNLTEVYLADGRMLSRSHCYVYRNDEDAYLIAIATQNQIADIDHEIVYLRTYTNAYYSSQRDTTGDDKVILKSIQVKTQSDIALLSNEFQVYRQLPYGHVMLYHNGYMVDNFRTADIKINDYIEFVFDASISEVIDFRLEYLPTFTSNMDMKQKYLLHPPKKLTTIQYRDDIDIYLIKKETGGKYRGKYYNHNRENSIRMITHRDWAILTEQVQQIYNSEPSWTNFSNLYVRVHLRKSGYDRALVDESNRIKELYKLSDLEIVRAMAGLDSTVPNWQINTLEGSSYTRLMRSHFKDLTGLEVAKAYGYNAMVKLTADTPTLMRNGRFDVPIGLQKNSTVFEYDSSGLLLGWRLHYGGDIYYPHNQNCTMVEIISGSGSRLAGFQLSTAPCVVKTTESFRVYVSPMLSNGQPTHEWADVTSNPEFYTLGADGKIQWKIDHAGQLGIVKTDSFFVCYDYNIKEHNHLYRFSLNHSEQNPHVMRIPPGRIDIWMNGRALIENIDYKVIYPEVVIWNKEYLKEGEQKFTIRATGFANEDFSRDISPQRGYIKHQMLSVNNIYDVREDKVIRVVANGRTFHRSALKYAEDQRNVILPGLADGRPYLIEDVIAPVRGVVDYNTYPYRNKGVETDQAVSDYLTRKLPERLPSKLHSIPERYAIYSPTMGRLVYDLGMSIRLPLAPETPEAKVAKFMEDYLWLLDYDPCREDDVDLRYTCIHPHPKYVVLPVSLYTFLFLQRINKLYLNERVDLSRFLKVVEEGEIDPDLPEPPEIPEPPVVTPVPTLHLLAPVDSFIAETVNVGTIELEVGDDYNHGVFVSEPY